MVLDQVAPVAPPEDAGRRPTSGPARAGRWLDATFGGVRWSREHERLAAQPVLADCDRKDIRHLARVGDQCIATGGAVLCHEGGIGYWFFLVVEGRVALSRGGVVSETIVGGGHLGAVPILGFGPHATTATATEDSVVYVLGRRHLLDLCHSMPGLRNGLYPDHSYEDFLATVRTLREEGLREWRAIQRAAPMQKLAAPQSFPPGLRVLSPRDRTRVSGAARGHEVEPTSGTPSPTPVRPVLTRKAVVVLTVLAVAAVSAVGFGYHPGIRVVTPSEAIDITGDVSVEGVPARAPAGRYILTAADVSEPHLVGAAHAYLTRQEILPRVDPARRDDAAGRREFVESQQRAVRLVAARAGVRPETVVVRFRHRDVSGPSAGLAYALLLADVTGQVEVPEGRVIAATGVVADDGGIGPVWFLSVKAAVARRAQADVFLVPAMPATPPPNDGRDRASRAAPVSSFDDALRVVSVPQPETSETTSR